MRQTRIRALALPILALVCALSAHAQVRSHVAIVRPVLHQSTKTFILNLADSMRKDGYDDASDYLKAWAEGGFGSGFVYVDPATGANYVVTNRHVVAQAEKVILEFEKDDGSVQSYSDCPVAAVSEALDLALVAFPAGAKPFSFGIPLSKILPDDGTDIWSAGFPGLLSRPSWQFGKGSVTNNRARIPELADPAVAPLIQHSAPIDGGSSGGPLLVADRSSKLGYSVAGINTWKVSGRQDTNFAIPAAHIASFVAASLAGPGAGNLEALKARAGAMTAAAYSPEEPYKKLVNYISYAYVSAHGEADLKNALARAPTAIRDAIIETFVGVSPIDGLRLASAWVLCARIVGAKGDALALSSAELSSGSEAVVRFTLGGSAVMSAWILEHGYWRVATFPQDGQAATTGGDTEPEDKRQASGGVISSPYTVALFGGANLDLEDSELFLVDFGLQALLGSDFATWYVCMSGGSALTWTGDKTRLISVRGGITLQLPILAGPLAITPFGRAGAGMLLPIGLEGSSWAGLLSELGGGLSIMLWESSIGLSVEYKYIRRLAMETLNDPDAPKPSNQVITLYLQYSLD